MGLSRLLTILLILWASWFLFRNWQRKQARRETERREQAQIKGGRQGGKQAEKVVRCAYCQVHLPEHEALRSGDDWFCTPAHKQAWLAKTGKNSSHNSPHDSSHNSPHDSDPS